MAHEIQISSLTELQAGYADRAYAPVDVVEEVLRRIDAAGDDRAWILRLSREDMTRQAAELGAKGRRAVGGALPLYGVPFAVKDNMDVAGMPTTAGCPDFAYVPSRTAPVVWRLLDAGALLV